LKFTAELHIINHQKWVLLKQCSQPGHAAFLEAVGFVDPCIRSLRPGILERLDFFSFCSGSHLRISACTAVMQPGIIIIIRAYMATLLHYCQHYASQSPSHLHRSILWCPSCMALLNLASFSCRGRWFWDQIPRIISPAKTAPLPLAGKEQRTQRKRRLLQPHKWV
jgi:hypothetical protein